MFFLLLTSWKRDTLQYVVKKKKFLTFYHHIYSSCKTLEEQIWKPHEDTESGRRNLSDLHMALNELCDELEC